ncbi:excinuclease ABC subunit UvrC [Aquimarina agarivorans]|uniref:excinuclease ABC subunit UvrC n=1 Tax=Aquimarina agarivorans TaxID=980584 RepID=UPI000248EFB5|nr:excinuclease ABC subunit UvrC [Aquimarina agarivorans]
MDISAIELQVKILPSTPGVYQYFDKDGGILYIGKAKNLKKRVASYFTKNHDSARLRILVRKIAIIKHIVVTTESDALLLENTLIKKHQPRYNILLKDDKSYPWICIKNERFPRVFSTRRMIKDGSEYFGPYTSGKVLGAVKTLIRELYPIRTCNYDLSKQNIDAGKYKLCLEYHLKNCKAPCEGYELESEYMQHITAIRSILKGNFKDALKSFTKKMTVHAEAMEFEQAQFYKNKIEALQNYQEKSTVVNPRITNVDVFSIESDESFAYVNFMQVHHGAIVRSHTTEIKKKLEETDAEILELAVVEFRNRFKSLSREVYLPFPVAVAEGLKVTIPQLGDKKKLVDLSLRNAKYSRQERFKQIKIVDPERHTKRMLAQIQKDLRLPQLPVHMECFDNSNIQGTNPVAACVVFKNAKPSKKDYRKFNIKTVEGPDDFASMEEVVYRRYKRLLEEEEPLPQLIILDGGKGQLSSGLKALEQLGIRGQVTIVGIAKRLEEIYYPDDSYPLYLDKKSESLKVIQHMRNEAHRFGITFHRQKRSKAALETELDSIPGIGEKTAISLLKHFRSVSRIKQATKQELVEVVGNSKAQKIIDFYKQ